MAEKQVPARLEMTAEIVDDLFLGRPIEVDEHVAAEDNIHPVLDTIPVLKEIEASESDE
jgi:hypothetical protein